jgi:uncharacterized protein DUF2786
MTAPTASAGKLAQIRALMDKAERTDNPNEQAAFQAKAEELMLKYRVAEEELIAKDQTALMPIPFDIKVSGRSQYLNHYAQMFGAIARHTGIKHAFEWTYDTEGSSVAEARGVGYASDVEYADLLFTQARLTFMERLEPKIKPDLDDQTNVYRLRSAGIERIRIADMMWGNTDKVFLGRVGRLYKAECASRGEEALLSGRGVTGAAYRAQYADQFVTTLTVRLYQAQDSAGRAGGGLVLHGRSERVTEAFYARFPNLRPKAAVEGGTYAPCPKCAKNSSGTCREHPAGRAVRGGPSYDSVAAERGRAAGRNAANSVNLRRGGTDSIGGA